MPHWRTCHTLLHVTIRSGISAAVLRRYVCQVFQCRVKKTYCALQELLCCKLRRMRVVAMYTATACDANVKRIIRRTPASVKKPTRWHCLAWKSGVSRVMNRILRRCLVRAGWHSTSRDSGGSMMIFAPSDYTSLVQVFPSYTPINEVLLGLPPNTPYDSYTRSLSTRTSRIKSRVGILSRWKTTAVRLASVAYNQDRDL